MSELPCSGKTELALRVLQCNASQQLKVTRVSLSKSMDTPSVLLHSARQLGCPFQEQMCFSCKVDFVSR